MIEHLPHVYTPHDRIIVFNVDVVRDLEFLIKEGLVRIEEIMCI